MTTHIKSILIFVILQLSISSWLFSEVTSANLLKSSATRLDGMDHEMNVDILTTNSKDKKENRKFDLSIHWDMNNDRYKMIFIKENNGKKNCLKAWAHHYTNNKVNKWVLLPKSGKIKNVTGKKTSEKLDLSEVSVSLDLLNKESTIKGEQTINDILCHLVEVSDDDEMVKIWIDPVDFIIHKKEYYNKKSKLFKTVNFSTLIEEDRIKYYKEASIYDLKKKNKIDITVQKISKKIFEDIEIFTPPLKDEN